MSKLIIRKRVTLEFLGDEYKDAYLVFRSLPVADYADLMAGINEASKEGSGKANTEILNILKKYFLEAKFPNDEGKLEDLDSADELGGLDKNTLLECFGKLIGQDLKAAIEDETAEGIDIDPKSDSPSKPGSTTASPHQ